MDSLCLKAAPPIAVAGGAALDVRASHVNASSVGRSCAGVSLEKPSLSRIISPRRLSFRKSRWSVGRRRYGASAIGGDDVVLIDENKAEEEKNAEKRAVEEQNDNWVMKILRVRSLRNGGHKSCGLRNSEAAKISLRAPIAALPLRTPVTLLWDGVCLSKDASLQLQGSFERNDGRSAQNSNKQYSNLMSSRPTLV
nr:phospholipase A1 PLIP2, chloroplastic-like isoform X1 [Ipomoea batatas]